MSAPVIYVRSAADDYHVAHIPALPGCFASGKTRDAAIANARRAFRALLELRDARGLSIDQWKDLDPSTFAVADTPPNNAWLPEDERPVEEHDLRDFLHQYEAQQAALMADLEGLGVADIERKPDDETWSVRETLEHVMTGEVRFLSRLERWPDDPFNTLQAVHRLVGQRFTVMEAPEERRRWEVMGTPFTVRRVMRRLLEHHWEHYLQVREILAALGKRKA